jgi:hypothetical protein
MPRKKRVIIDSEIPDAGITTDEGEQILFGDDTPIDDTFNQFGESEPFLMKVYKITPSGSSFVFSTTEKPDPANFESSIQERYPAGGKMVVRFYKNNRIVEPSRHVEIEPKVLTTLPTNVNESVYSVQVKMLTDQLMMMQNMVMAFIGRPVPVAQQTPVNELVTVMTAMQGIQGNRTDSVDMLIKGMELAKGLNGGSEDWKSTLISSAKEVLSPVAGIIAQHKMNQGNPNPLPIQPQQLTERNNGAVIHTDMLIKQGLAWLKPKIIAGFPVELAVEWIWTNGNDGMYQPFLAKAIQGDVNTFIEIDPELANEPYKSWLTTAINMLKDAYANNNNQADNDGGTGDNSDVTGNAPISSGLSKVS